MARKIFRHVRNGLQTLLEMGARRRSSDDARLRAMEAEIAEPRAALHRTHSDLLARIDGSVNLTAQGSIPNITPLSLALRDMDNLRWNSKVLGAALADRLYKEGRAGRTAPVPKAPERRELTSKLCVQADIESNWLRHWCGQLHVPPTYSRKIWEYGFVLQALWEAGVIRAGAKGLGFAVGSEPIPAFLASRDIAVLATDLSPDDSRAEAWRNTGQHASALKGLFRKAIVSEEKFDRLCAYRSVDMNEIPEDLTGQFDFCWSMCSFEHVGSVEKGLKFVENSVRCLKPGGVAVHTTEYNLSSATETIDNWPTVLFQARHIEVLKGRLEAAGHELLPVNYDPGNQLLDAFVDGPPYPWQPRPSLQLPASPHLRLNVDGFFSTSIGLIIRAKRA